MTWLAAFGRQLVFDLELVCWALLLGGLLLVAVNR